MRGDIHEIKLGDKARPLVFRGTMLVYQHCLYYYYSCPLVYGNVGLLGRALGIGGCGIVIHNL